MAFGVYYRAKGSRAYKRAQEWVTPTRQVKFSCNGKIPVDIRCVTIEEAKEVETKYLVKGLETKIKEVK